MQNPAGVRLAGLVPCWDQCLGCGGAEATPLRVRLDTTKAWRMTRNGSREPRDLCVPVTELSDDGVGAVLETGRGAEGRQRNQLGGYGGNQGRGVALGCGCDSRERLSQAARRAQLCVSSGEREGSWADSRPC